ncbi:hypothetical protein DAEQUDRAFT_307132 [Daedalea quercina L-15889]|uniref:DUF6533 domain-containing protein n=1 Tax=Daedalea quercina L-15889 TaxID=1314783 RepID=A0A165Q2W4_9APHY|nr:hypothetical protein DAEQUDRAFT_307132 [Daedalea quercina L-15889]
MSSISAGEAEAIVSGTRIVSLKNRLATVIITVLLYDHALTFGSEVELFWCRGPLVARACLFSLRLSSLGYLVAMILNIFSEQLNMLVKSCVALRNVYMSFWTFGMFVTL